MATHTNPALLTSRVSGILAHPSSLPGGYGIGDLGAASAEFVDFLADAKQSIWQVLPMGPTVPEEYHSPYASVSAFAGNPLLISLDTLVKDGLLGIGDIARQNRKTPCGRSSTKVDFRALTRFKLPLLHLAARNFAGSRADAAIERFSAENSWAANYAQYAALRERFKTTRQNWPRALRFKPVRLTGLLAEPLSSEELRTQLVMQLLFAKQWAALRLHAARKGVSLWGDLPIYVSNDSADVWAHPEYFEVDRKTGAPGLISGVPPDMFNSKGQLWGHPLYNWKALKHDRFRWWIERFRSLQHSFDIVRVDHFRGFESYWAVPGGSDNATGGTWMKCPGKELFSAVSKAFGSLPLFVEDLGIITPEVHALREHFGLMGTRVLQFSFSGDPANSSKSRHHPINTPHHAVTYTGTHDNPPVAEWFASLPAANKAKIRGLLNDCKPGDVPLQFVRLAMSLPARIAIVPMQDVLGAGKGHRMNVPGTVSWNNWAWRFTSVPKKTATRLAHLSEVFERNQKI